MPWARGMHPWTPIRSCSGASYSDEPRIRSIGVWDTVSSPGIPATGLGLARLVNPRWEFHDTTLSTVVDAAFRYWRSTSTGSRGGGVLALGARRHRDVAHRLTGALGHRGRAR